MRNDVIFVSGIAGYNHLPLVVIYNVMVLNYRMLRVTSDKITGRNFASNLSNFSLCGYEYPDNDLPFLSEVLHSSEVPHRMKTIGSCNLTIKAIHSGLSTITSSRKFRGSLYGSRTDGVDMILLEKMQKAGIHKYNQVFGYCKEHNIKPAFKARHATVLFIEEATSANRPDYMIYMINATIKKPPIELLEYNARATSTIIVINKI